MKAVMGHESSAFYKATQSPGFDLIVDLWFWIALLVP